MTTYALEDIQALIKTMKSYISDTLGFDRDIDVRFYIKEDSFTCDIDADDNFQSRIDRYSRVGRLGIWEVDDTLDDVIASVWDKLNGHMKRDERELRFGLTQLGNALEGDEFNTEVGKMIAERMRVIRDDISAKYLPLYEKKED